MHDVHHARLPDLGAALEAGLCELNRDLTVDRIDQMAMKLKAADQSLLVMRRALIEGDSFRFPDLRPAL